MCIDALITILDIYSTMSRETPQNDTMLPTCPQSLPWHPFQVASPSPVPCASGAESHHSPTDFWMMNLCTSGRRIEQVGQTTTNNSVISHYHSFIHSLQTFIERLFKWDYSEASPSTAK